MRTILGHSAKQVVDSLVTAWRRSGSAGAVRLLADRVINRFVNLSVINVVWLDRGDLRLPPPTDARFELRFLTVDEVRHFAAEIGEEFAERAAGGRDLCFAALAGERLAAYGWYALESIEARHASGVAMSYPMNVAYMYNGFTHPDFRGARLHGAIMGLALQQLAERGVSRLVSFVDWTNTASMTSCYRIGYVLLGRVWRIRLRSHELLLTPRRARDLGVRFGGAATPRPSPPLRTDAALDSTDGKLRMVTATR
jgi:hypothetical protein